MGAWIETEPLFDSPFVPGVALYMGAWIETCQPHPVVAGWRRRTLYGCVDWNNEVYSRCLDTILSHSIWVRGLKLSVGGSQVVVLRSHSIWVRGLKRVRNATLRTIVRSHSIWVRGLKLIFVYQCRQRTMSHSIWVRGLKLLYCIVAKGIMSRTLYGCVDWNNWSMMISWII